MKQLTSILLTFCCCKSIIAQHGFYGTFVPPFDRSPNHLILTINPQDGAYLKKDLGLTDYTTEINGEKILGTPVLLYEWANGTLTTANGNTYNYPLRYNVYQQLVSFVIEKDTLDITDEIKSFSLAINVNDTAVTLQFVNANQYKHEAKTFYYQVILDYSKGQLLKTNYKTIASLTSGLLSSKGSKYFELKSEYYYYDKGSNKIVKITSDSTNVKKMLKLDDMSAEKTKVDSYDFTNDEELIKFFKLYFALN